MNLNLYAKDKFKMEDKKKQILSGLALVGTLGISMYLMKGMYGEGKH